MQENIIDKVLAAKHDKIVEEEIIREYMPFIKAETSRFINRPVLDDDDEQSIAMIAFYEAIKSFDDKKGAFIPYASMIIQNRLIDNYRKERRHKDNISIFAPISENEGSIEEVLPDNNNQYEDIVHKEATRNEIEELTAKLKEYGVSLTDVADNCPRQKRSKEACIKAMLYVRDNRELLQEFLKTKKIPAARIVKDVGISPKTLERHRKYIVALFVICTNGYEIIRGHLRQVMKGGRNDEIYGNGMSR
jgi:RNA polymerase sigma factor